jgi:hypothetical protein
MAGGVTMQARIEAAIRRVGCGPEVIREISVEILKKTKEIAELNREVLRLKNWIGFHAVKQAATYGEFRLYEINDGETHHVVARCSADAMKYYADSVGLDESSPELRDATLRRLPPDIGLLVWDENGGCEIKSCAGWASINNPTMISSTVW